jgi:FkbM family methyltransferase
LKDNASISRHVIEQNQNLKDRIKIFPYGISNINSEMNMRSMVKHGYIQTGGSSITTDNVSQNNKYKVYKGEFKFGDEILNLKRDNLAIKIDVEGHELNVLKGIQNLLKSNKCIIQIEIFEKNFNSVNSYLLERNFILIDQFQQRSNYFYSNY